MTGAQGKRSTPRRTSALSWVEGSGTRDQSPQRASTASSRRASGKSWARSRTAGAGEILGYRAGHGIGGSRGGGTGYGLPSSIRGGPGIQRQPPVRERRRRRRFLMTSNAL
jgi:hypothetical protein